MNWENELVAKLNQKPVLVRGKWIVGAIVDGKLSVAPQPKNHESYPQAEREARRLAEMTPGKSFVVLNVQTIMAAEEVPQPKFAINLKNSA